MKKIMFNDKCGLTKAVLEERKTMTRRILKAPRTMEGKDVYGFSVVTYRTGDVVEVMALDEDEAMIGNILPKYKVGEVVAVAQSYMNAGYDKNTIQRATFRTNAYGGKQIGDFKICLLPGWENKMYVFPSMMPHQIRITNIRVERLQDISDEDCLKEGIYNWKDAPDCPTLTRKSNIELYGFDGVWDGFVSPRAAFAALIDKISGKNTWNSNLYVFVYEFELIK